MLKNLSAKHDQGNKDVEYRKKYYRMRQNA